MEDIGETVDEETGEGFDFEEMEDSFDLWELFSPPKRERVDRTSPEYRAAHRVKNREESARRKAMWGSTAARAVSGGRGLCPTYEGRAAAFYLHPSLTSIPRLVVVTWLARHGPAPIADLARVACLQKPNVCALLRALQRIRLVEDNQPVKRGALWAVTDVCRTFLWRAGFVHRKVLFLGSHAPLRNDVNRDPVRALQRHAQALFLRPAALALAWELHWCAPASLRDLARFSGLSPATVSNHLRLWVARGWVEQTGEQRNHFRDRRFRRLWAFTPAGRLALARHVDAMRRAARASGYDPTPADWFYPWIPAEGESYDPIEANSVVLNGKRYLTLPRGAV